MNNQVARYLLANGLETMGVVYLDDKDRKVILLRAGLRVLSLAREVAAADSPSSTRCTRRASTCRRRSARAAVTLGKDMTFRLCAGRLPHARRRRWADHHAAAHATGGPPGAHEVARMRHVALASQKTLQASHEQLLRTVCAWLVVSQMRSEDVQAGLLGEQRLAHVFRKRSLEHLLAPPPMRRQ